MEAGKRNSYVSRAGQLLVKILRLINSTVKKLNFIEKSFFQIFIVISKKNKVTYK